MKVKIMNIRNHIFELRNEEINVKKILAVINATYATFSTKPQKIPGPKINSQKIPCQIFRRIK